MSTVAEIFFAILLAAAAAVSWIGVAYLGLMLWREIRK